MFLELPSIAELWQLRLKYRCSEPKEQKLTIYVTAAYWTELYKEQSRTLQLIEYKAVAAY